jgi:hypothetical protein
MRQTIGTFEDPEVKAMFENDKMASDLANSKGEMYKRVTACVPSTWSMS